MTIVDKILIALLILSMIGLLYLIFLKIRMEIYNKKFSKYYNYVVGKSFLLSDKGKKKLENLQDEPEFTYLSNLLIRGKYQKYTELYKFYKEKIDYISKKFTELEYFKIINREQTLKELGIEDE